MAAEDVSDPPANPTTIPPYPEMILSAIGALNEEHGSNKSSISKQIESTYGALPPAHATLLSHHLNKMKQSGQLSLLKNNYLVPDPTSPPRRGRGRPPKPKSAAAAAYTGPPRPRGRPPKAVDPNAPPPAAGSGSGRGRGRPPKKAKTGGDAAAAAVGGVKRGRGRPPKVKAEGVAVGV